MSKTHIEELVSKIDKIGSQLKDLRERELKKSLIPVHNHHAGTVAGAGIEDVPPGKMNPKGVDKSEKCMKCGEMHKPLDKCGEMKVAAKSELVDAKGKLSSNSVKTPLKSDGKEVEAKGSGGIILPGSKLKKAIKKAMTAGMGNSMASTKVNDLGKDDMSMGQDLSKPPVSQKQRAAMGAAANGKSTLHIPKSVGKEFIAADKGGKLPAKKAEPPMAKPPSGKNMATHVPTSAPKAPKAAPAMASIKPPPGIPALKSELEKGMFAQAAQHADPISHSAAVMNAAVSLPKQAPKMPSQQQHAGRAASFGAAMGGAFQPKGKVSSGLELAKPRPGIFGKLGKTQKKP